MLAGWRCATAAACRACCGARIRAQWKVGRRARFEGKSGARAGLLWSAALLCSHDRSTVRGRHCALTLLRGETPLLLLARHAAYRAASAPQQARGGQRAPAS